MSEFMYELPKNRMVQKFPVCGLSGLRRKRDAAFAASREYVIVQVSTVQGIKMRYCLLFSG